MPVTGQKVCGGVVVVVVVWWLKPTLVFSLAKAEQYLLRWIPLQTVEHLIRSWVITFFNYLLHVRENKYNI